MDGIALLKRDALIRRNAKILAAKREYYATLREIKGLQKRLNIKHRGRPPKLPPVENALLKATPVAKEILREGHRLTLVELTLEVQRRGCRTLDDRRDVAKAIRNGLNHWRGEFKRDAEGRWKVSDVSLGAN